MRMFIGYFLMGYLLASLKIEKMTDILRMRRFQTLMTSVRVEIRQNLWQVRFVLLRMLWSANLKAGGFLFILKETDVCNFADDTTPHVCDGNIEQILISLEHDSAIAICWFESNYMKLNTDNCHLLVSGNKNEHMWAKVGNDKIWESSTV